MFGLNERTIRSHIDPLFNAFESAAPRPDEGSRLKAFSLDGASNVNLCTIPAGLARSALVHQKERRRHASYLIDR